MSRSSDTKSRFIQSAATLFQQRGYNGVGLTEIIQTSLAPKGSFYHHFPQGKEQLAEHSLRWAGAFVGKHIDRSFENAPNFNEGVRKMAEITLQWLEESNWSLGCPITSVAVDMGPRSERLIAATREMFEDWLRRIEAHAARLQVKEPPDQLAMRLLSALEGAWIVARVLRSPEPLRQIIGLFGEMPKNLGEGAPEPCS